MADLTAGYALRQRDTAAWVCLVVNNLGTRKEALRVDDIFKASQPRRMTRAQVAETRAALQAVAAQLDAKRRAKEASHGPSE